MLVQGEYAATEVMAWQSLLNVVKLVEGPAFWPARAFGVVDLVEFNTGVCSGCGRLRRRATML